MSDARDESDSVPVHGFTRTFTGRIVLRVDVVERGLLISLLEQLIDLLSPAPTTDVDPLQAMVGIDAQANRPTDEVVARLLPDAYSDDEEASADFRRFTERGLRETKVTHARQVLEALGTGSTKITMSPEQAESWLLALNDLRLALGTRLGVSDDNHDELIAQAEENPEVAAIHVYDWLTFLSETLVRCLLPTR